MHRLLPIPFVVAGLALGLSLMGGRSEPVPLPLPRPLPPIETFDGHWPVGVKSDRYRPPAPQQPEPAAVEPVVAVASLVELPNEPPQKVKRYRRVADGYDICRGKGRRYTNGGRSWRCNR